MHYRIASILNDEQHVFKELYMSRRRRGQLSYRQMLAIAAILLALLALTGLGGIPWLPIAVIVLALTAFA
jgi:hypothetical protein